MSVMSGRFLDPSSSWVSFRAKNPSEVRMLVSSMTMMSWAKLTKVFLSLMQLKKW